MKDNATLMMVTYNRIKLTKQTFDNLFKVTKYPFNLIIVDNGSTDGTVEYLKGIKNNQYNNCSNIILHFNEINKGIASGRNTCLNILNNEKMFKNTKWLCTLDNDIQLPDTWLTECVDIMSANTSYCIGVNFEGKSYALVTKNNKTFQEKPRGNLGTACAVFPKSLFKMIGYFNNYKYYAHEDANYFFRARMCGFKMGYIKKNGLHLGEGENDTGEYRDFKDQWHKKNLSEFHSDCAAYARREKPIYIPYKD